MKWDQPSKCTGTTAACREQPGCDGGAVAGQASGTPRRSGWGAGQRRRTGSPRRSAAETPQRSQTTDLDGGVITRHVDRVLARTAQHESNHRPGRQVRRPGPMQRRHGGDHHFVDLHSGPGLESGEHPHPAAPRRRPWSTRGRPVAGTRAPSGSRLSACWSCESRITSTGSTCEGAIAGGVVFVRPP